MGHPYGEICCHVYLRAGLCSWGGLALHVYRLTSCNERFFFQVFAREGNVPNIIIAVSPGSCPAGRLGVSFSFPSEVLSCAQSFLLGEAHYHQSPYSPLGKGKHFTQLGREACGLIAILICSVLCVGVEGSRGSRVQTGER